MMDSNSIERVQKLSSEIESFRSCYDGNELWGEVEGPVSYGALLAFLIDNPHMQDIANKVDKLNKELKS